MRNGFFWAIALSVGFHAALLTYTPHFPRKISPVLKNPEMTFVKIKDIKDAPKIIKPAPHLFKPPAGSQLLKSLTPPKYIPAPAHSKEKSVLDKSLFRKPSLDKLTFAQEKVMFIKPNNIKNKSPAYMSYYETIREKIRRHAYTYYEISSGGKVFVNFTLDQKGNLVNLYLDRNRSEGSAYLQDITIKSIKESLPFPEFPANLKKFKTLTFSLTVYFKSN